MSAHPSARPGPSAAAADPERAPASVSRPPTPAAEVRRPGFLTTVNPLAKIFGPLPIMLAVLFSRELLLPAVCATCALALILLGARLGARTTVLLVLGTPVLIALLGLSFGLWTDPARIAADAPGASLTLVELGDWRFSLAAYLVGLATALRIAAILMLSLIAGVSTTGPELVRALVQHLRVPYRVGYTALAALRFVPRFRYELEVIRSAHRVRGVDHGRGPIGWFRRTIGLAIPLLASAIRHAERVALAMDARAFGAHATRTERTISRWRTRDTVFLVACGLAAAAAFWWLFAR